ncbi:hypothetical protein GOP47_0001651 [Adiantum capillus-veneris]|uniref:Uncharacterized protein n=1 Tax=Adiantum capillus-veneris TaxID=13818 RepID=A0A9D4ZN98_ADICA|nr:hypothetical protein GOP47_0001651 [Adiantum capillus-veneris]
MESLTPASMQFASVRPTPIALTRSGHRPPPVQLRLQRWPISCLVRLSVRATQILLFLTIIYMLALMRAGQRLMQLRQA